MTSATALKTVPACDATASTGNKVLSREHSVFGPANGEYANFMEDAWNNHEVSGDGSGFSTHLE